VAERCQKIARGEDEKGEGRSKERREDIREGKRAEKKRRDGRKKQNKLRTRNTTVKKASSPIANHQAAIARIDH